MSKKTRVAFLFPSTHYAMEAEDILLKAKLRPQTVPLPSELGLGCGTAVTVSETLAEKARSLLHQNDIPITALFTVDPRESLWQSRIFGDICDIF